MSDFANFPLATPKIVYERCLAYRRAMARSSNAVDVFSVLDDASEDPLVSLSAFFRLCVFAEYVLNKLRSVQTDK